MGRAIGVTNAEISTSFWLIGLITFLVCFVVIWDIWKQAPLVEFIIVMFLLIISFVFFTMAWFWMNYVVSKLNLNLLIDRITNPDYIGWIRFTRSKGLRFNIVKTGPLGQTKGIANGAKADVINNGDYTVTLQNGNKAIIKSDLLTTNINLDQCVGWQLIKKHFGVIGYKAWEKCVDDKQTLFKIEEKKDDRKEV